MPGLIPQRPNGRVFPLKQEEMDGLSYYVLSGCKREEAFLKFIRPDFIGTKATAAVKGAVSQFFAMKEVKDYIEAYSETVKGLLERKPEPVDHSGTLEERKARAKAKATEFAISMANDIDKAADPEFVLKLMDKVGLLDQDEHVEAEPGRFLPVRCSECEYRKFCEENCDRVEDGTEIE